MSDMKSIRFPPPTADEEIRAILADRKTATRRVVKPQHLRVLSSPYHRQHPEVPDKVLLEKLCEPPYRPGDILYVRETWAKVGDNAYGYKADDVWIVPRWRPSIHMPREAARIFLRVTDVRVERLQDITEEQARAEGAQPLMITTDVEKPDCEKMWDEWLPALPSFIHHWDSTIKPADRALYGWAANPWVRGIEFERISKEEAMQ